MMKRILVTSLFALAVATSPLDAHEPTVDLTIATAIAVPTFPTTVQIPMTVTHGSGCPMSVTGGLGCLNAFDVKVEGLSLLPGGVPIGNPFNNSSQCTAAMTSNGLTCATTGTPPTSAVVEVPWTIGAPGSYVVAAEIRHQSEEGDDHETVAVQLIVAEYPAPPSLANDYIKSQGYKLTGGKRGCIINAIAQNHANGEKYGPKGGPYDEALVASDVEAFLTICQ